jgi:L-asparaginase II
MAAEAMIDVWRGDLVESQHLGHAVVVDARGEIVAAWGDLGHVIYPRSACKMVQALPLLRSGAADAAGLTDAQLALACASHSGAAIHTEPVRAWLDSLGLSTTALRCGPQEPGDRPTRDALIRAGAAPGQEHNNCSGKHTGFLTLARHLRAGPEYIELDHPVQAAVRTAFEEVTGAASPAVAIDGCSAPNFATTIFGLARAMACFADAAGRGDGDRDARRLVHAMLTYPQLVAGEGRACTRLMRAMGGDGVVKTGAEGVFTAILPGRGLGIALKIADGATRAAEAAIAALLIDLGILDPADPVASDFIDAPIRNRRGLEVGAIRRAPGFP